MEIAQHMDAFVTLVVTVGVLAGLVWNRWPAEWLMMAAAVSLILLGVISPATFLAGFANPGIMTIGALFVVAAGVQETGALRWMLERLLGRPSSPSSALARLMPITSLLSAFLNNTPVVALFIGLVQGWCARMKIPPSRLLMPMSYAAILGGTCTLIGTSTNLVVDGLLQSQANLPGLGIFDISALGVPVLIVGTLWMVLIGWRFLPQRKGLVEQLGNGREYSVAMRVADKGPLHDKSIEEAGLRSLQFGYLAEIERSGKLLSMVGPDTILQSGDRLIFVGVADTAHEVRVFRGLESDAAGLDLDHHQRRMVEAVIAPSSPVVGMNVREARFRTRYQSVILAVSRDGERINSKVGDIVLRPGDTLLLEAAADFTRLHRYNREFLLVSTLDGNGMPNLTKAPIALAIMSLMIITHLAGMVELVEAAVAAAILMVFTGCLPASQARASIDGSVLVVIAAALGLGQAMTDSGAAQMVADQLMQFGGGSPFLMLVLVYLTTTLFTEIITNNAAAVLMFPIAMAVSEQMGVSLMPYAIAIMFAASASFLTPLGYQTNLMVMGPGGYKVSDYMKVGLPMSLIVGIASVALIPLIWPFTG